MARGTDPLNDPRWEGQDSQSLPDRAAHPDPSRVAEFGDPAETPSHGIYGFLEHKHNLADESTVLASRAAGAKAQADALEAEQSALQGRVDAGDDAAKSRLKQVTASLKAARSDAGDAEITPDGNDLARAVQAGEVVPSVENATPAESSSDGKVSEVRAANAPTKASA
jgi:hypothetical protein